MHHLWPPKISYCCGRYKQNTHSAPCCMNVWKLAVGAWLPLVTRKNTINITFFIKLRDLSYITLKSWIGMPVLWELKDAPLGMHSLLELGTMWVHDHEINVPNVQDCFLLQMIYIQICSQEIPSNSYTSQK